ncbi:MAG: hypothetical protein VB853_02170 [Pirellulales bacterium]
MQPTTVYRVQHQTVYDECKVIRYQPKWETRIQQCRYRVARPVTQTVEREERYIILRPVWKTQTRDASYNRIRNIVETQQRQETYSVSRPVYVTETQQRHRRVREYVSQTVYRNVQRVQFQPVTTYTTKYVDQGRYVDRRIQIEQNSGYSLCWVPGGWSPDPQTGRRRFDIAGPAWIPKYRQIKTVNRQTWQPNLVAQQIPHKTFRRVSQTMKVPTQVNRWVEREVVENVPVRVMKMVTENKTRTVPYTTTRQIIERVDRKIPVCTCEWVREEHTRKVPVTYTRLMYEERVEQVPVRCCKLIAVEETIRRPRLESILVPLESQCYLPQTQILQLPRNAGAPLVEHEIPTDTSGAASSNNNDRSVLVAGNSGDL